jgi:hypothetical protein
MKTDSGTETEHEHCYTPESPKHLKYVVLGSGQVRYRLGDRLVDRYLEFVAGRCRPNTLRAVAFDLKAFSR